MKKGTLIVLVVTMLFSKSFAQIDFDKVLNMDNLQNLLGKTMNVKKGFAPKFSIGSIAIPNINKLGEVFGLKQNEEINRLFKTYKTGRTVYRIASYAGSAIVIYGSVKSLDKAAIKQDYQGALISGLSGIGVGLLSKLLTKQASYKAVDLFNGMVKRKIKDILSVKPASATIGMGVYVKL